MSGRGEPKIEFFPRSLCHPFFTLARLRVTPKPNRRVLGGGFVEVARFQSTLGGILDAAAFVAFILRGIGSEFKEDAHSTTAGMTCPGTNDFS